MDDEKVFLEELEADKKPGLSHPPFHRTTAKLTVSRRVLG